MKVVDGNLLDLADAGAFDVIAHGCNCFCVMGAGIALQIAGRYPQAELADEKTAPGDNKKLGTFTYTTHRTAAGSFYIVNAYTQYRPGVDVSYEAIRTAFKGIRERFGVLTANGVPRRFGIPRIGAGFAGGYWPTIRAIIEEEMAGEDVTLVEYMP